MSRRSSTAYTAYFERNAQPTTQQKLQMLDPAPRVVLDPELGLCTIGRSAQEASIAFDIYAHTIDIILRAHALAGGYQALPESDIFDVEYWDLEQAKLRRGGSPPVFAGEVALVTGAASGIGKACVDALLKRGAAVVGLDINPAICEQHAWSRRLSGRRVRRDRASQARATRSTRRSMRSAAWTCWC